MRLFLKRVLPVVEFSMRLYVAYYLFDYGLSKLTGNMFNNTPADVLKTELQKVDSFHLTWYFFYKSKLLTYCIGICQMLAAAFLLYSRTVLLGCFIGLTIFLNVFLIDISVFSEHVLATRVFLYMTALLFSVYYRRKALAETAKIIFRRTYRLRIRNYAHLSLIPVFLALFLGVEIVVCYIINLFGHL